MSQITNVKSTHMNWGPYVMKTKAPDYIIEKMKIEGKKTKQSYIRHRQVSYMEKF